MQGVRLEREMYMWGACVEAFMALKLLGRQSNSAFAVLTVYICVRRDVCAAAGREP